MIVCWGCTSPSTDQPAEVQSTEVVSEALPSTPAPTVQEVDFSDPTPELTQQLVRRELSPADNQRFLDHFSSKPHAWLDQVYDHLDGAGLSEEQSLAQCDLLTQLAPSQEALSQHQLDPYAVKEFPLWYHLVFQKYCETIKRLDQQISRVEETNLSIRATRRALEQESRERILELAGAMVRRDEVAKGYWLLKGFLVNPGDSIYEISMPNLFESTSLICTSSTDCSSMADIRAKISGGFRDRVLLNSTTRYHSKGRIEMLVTYDRTETLYTRSGERVEWAVMNEASHYPLLAAQRDYLQAKERSDSADEELGRAPSETNLSDAYTHRDTAKALLVQGFSTYREGRAQLPIFVENQDLWIRAELYDLCDQLEWEGRAALKRKATKEAYRESLKKVDALLKRVQRISCALGRTKRKDFDRFEGTLELITYQKNPKPKGSAMALRYEVSWEALFSPEGEMTLEVFDPKKMDEEPSLVETPPSLTRKGIAKRYKLHRPTLSLKRDYSICEAGVEGYQSPRLKRAAGAITAQDKVLAVGQPRRGSVKVELFGRRALYLPADQECIKRERQDGNFRSLFTSNHEMKQIEVSNLPSTQGELRQIEEASFFLIEHKMGEKKRWSSGWLLNGEDRGRRVYIQSELLEPKRVDVPVGQPI